MHSTSWGGVPKGTLWMRFICCPNLMLLASLWLKLYRFSNFILLTFSSSKLILMLLTLVKSKLTLLVSFSWLWTGHSYFTGLGQNRLQKTIQTHTVWWKIQESSIWSGTSAGIKNWVPQSINRLQKFSLLFLFVKRFSDYACQSSFPLFFIKFLFFHQIIALQKQWETFFIWSKKLFSFSIYSNFYNFFQKNKWKWDNLWCHELACINLQL